MLTGELNDIRQQLKEKEAELEMKVVALTQQMEENQTLSTQIERIEQETTAKIEVCNFFFQYNSCWKSVVCELQCLLFEIGCN